MDIFGGEEGFQTRQLYDNIKKQYCNSHNIKLVIIPYSTNTNKITLETLEINANELQKSTMDYETNR